MSRSPSFRQKKAVAAARWRWFWKNRRLYADRWMVYARWKTPLPAFGPAPVAGHFFWWLEWFFCTLDLCGFCLFYETLADLLKWNTRGLTAEEIAPGRQVFGDQIEYSLVRVDERAWAGPRQFRFAYVSFFTINAWGKMHPVLLVHELAHVWQYQRLGAVYIVRALRAQRTAMGYNYGGGSALKENPFLPLNLEQQAEVFTDLFRLKNGWRPCWGKAGPADIPFYEACVHHLLDR